MRHTFFLVIFSQELIILVRRILMRAFFLWGSFVLLWHPGILKAWLPLNALTSIFDISPLPPASAFALHIPV